MLTERSDRDWRLVYIARVVPIKGLLDLHRPAGDARATGASPTCTWTSWGPPTHVPEYYEACLAKIERAGARRSTSRSAAPSTSGTCWASSTCWCCPATTRASPSSSSRRWPPASPPSARSSGGMRQLIADRLTTPDGRTWAPAAKPSTPVDWSSDGRRASRRCSPTWTSTRAYAANARTRVQELLPAARGHVRVQPLYRALGDLPGRPTAGEIVDERRDGRNCASGVGAWIRYGDPITPRPARRSRRNTTARPSCSRGRRTRPRS